MSWLEISIRTLAVASSACSSTAEIFYVAKVTYYAWAIFGTQLREQNYAPSFSPLRQRHHQRSGGQSVWSSVTNRFIRNRMFSVLTFRKNEEVRPYTHHGKPAHDTVLNFMLWKATTVRTYGRYRNARRKFRIPDCCHNFRFFISYSHREAGIGDENERSHRSNIAWSGLIL